MYSIGWLQSGNMHCIYMRDEGYILCELRLPSFLHFVTYWQKYWLMLSKPIRETIYQAEPDQLWFLNTWEHTDIFLEEKNIQNCIFVNADCLIWRQIEGKLWQIFYVSLNIEELQQKQETSFWKVSCRIIKEGADARIERNPYLNGIQNPGYAKTNPPFYMEMKQ